MTKHLFLFIILVIIFLVPGVLQAQIKEGDVLDIPDSLNALADSALIFTLEPEKDPDNRPVRIGLVLSGGGAKGLAHVGVLKVLEREGIHIDYIGGTSMGGLVAGLYAAGYTPEQLDEISNKLPWSKLLADEKERRDLPLQEKTSYDQNILSLPMIGFIPGLPKGLKEGQLVVNVLNKLTWQVNDIHQFEDLPTPFFCVATDLATGDTVLIREGDLPMALRATMSIPSVFAPVKIDDKMVIDGGIVNNFPVDIMMSMGVDYVIGVDVGAPLYKSDEIKSVLNILDQISSYHQQQRYHDNVNLTDIYIKPDISGLSAMSFDDVSGIIKRGEDAAMLQIDAIRKLAAEIRTQKYKPRTFKLKMADTVYISSMEVVGLDKVGLKMVVGRLGINIPGVNTIKNINAAIDRLYSSNFFKFINYKLIKDRRGYILKIEVEENSHSLFNVGGRYDTDLGASLLLNVELTNKLIAGSRMDFTLKVGPNPRGGIQFLVDRGQNLGFGINIHYNSNYVKTYSDDFNTIMGSYFMSFTSLDLILFSNYSNNASFKFGGTMDFLSITTEVSPVPIDYHGDPFLNIFAEYILDSYDNKYYPHEGSYVKLNPVFVSQYNKKSVFYVNAEIGSVVNIHKNFSLLPSAFIGASWGPIENTGYFYMLGGAGMNNFYNMHNFIGLPFSAIFTNNLAYGRLDIRYQFFEKHYIILKTNIASHSEFFEELLTNSEFVYGGGLAYSLNSLVGPIELGVNVSNLHYNPSVFVNIGFFF
jgi:NTE family protein